MIDYDGERGRGEIRVFQNAELAARKKRQRRNLPLGSGSGVVSNGLGGVRRDGGL